ncbi:hypothetical protein BpHYR1_016519 [Brachionus plicatilis]|uniref:Uncharacterized protein n=1 Tax=Brachionus plicatilis TaxID=10195 RepID=A0A3M7R7T3_BRAPC|nr:hypothetical protein BpHYR1_016519 [Brachionus plicatilis]
MIIWSRFVCLIQNNSLYNLYTFRLLKIFRIILLTKRKLIFIEMNNGKHILAFAHTENMSKLLNLELKSKNKRNSIQFRIQIISTKTSINLVP